MVVGTHGTASGREGAADGRESEAAVREWEERGGGGLPLAASQLSVNIPNHVVALGNLLVVEIASKDRPADGSTDRPTDESDKGVLK